MPAAGTEPVTTANGGSFPVSQALDASPDDQLALIGTIEVPAVGALETLDLQFYRNNRQTWLVSIDRITVETAGGKTLIHLSMWDRLRQDVRPLNYRIEGTVTLSASGK